MYKILVFMVVVCVSPLLAQYALAEQVFIFNNQNEPESIDPTIAAGAYEESVLNALFEGLTNKDPKTLEPIPGVAEKWEISKDGKVYTFHLRKSAKWSNGDVVTAHDFYYTWYRLLDPKTGATLAYHMYYIEGAEEFVRGALKDFTKVGIKVIDNQTLQVTLKHPVSYFLFLCSFYPLFPVHKRTVELFKERWTRPENIVGNGPFVLETWKPNDRIVVTKSPTYWNKEQVKLDKVVMLPIENRETALNMYKSGKIHWTGQSYLPIPRIAELAKRSDYYSPARLATDFIRLNVNNPPFDNLLVRQALSLAIDRDTIVSKITKAGERPARSFSPPIQDYIPGLTASFDPKKAASLLKQAGYCVPNDSFKGCKAFPKVELLYNTNRRHQKVLLVIQQMWKQHLGINSVSLLNREWKSYLKDLKASNFVMIRSGWVADFPDPISFVEIFHSHNPRNFTGWSNTEFDRLIEESKKQPDDKKRLKGIQKAEQILMSELPMIPVYHLSSPYLLSEKIDGFHENFMDVHPLSTVQVKD